MSDLKVMEAWVKQEAKRLGFEPVETSTSSVIFETKILKTQCLIRSLFTTYGGTSGEKVSHMVVPAAYAGLLGMVRSNSYLLLEPLNENIDSVLDVMSFLLIEPYEKTDSVIHSSNLQKCFENAKELI